MEVSDVECEICVEMCVWRSVCTLNRSVLENHTTTVSRRRHATTFIQHARTLGYTLSQLILRFTSHTITAPSHITHSVHSVKSSPVAPRAPRLSLLRALVQLPTLAPPIVPIIIIP